MGTRHLIAVKVGGEFKVAQYGQWDGYPSGQGRDILTFLYCFKQRTLALILKEKVKALSFLTPEEVKARWVECGADPKCDWVTMDVSNKMKEKYPELTRDTGSNILRLIWTRLYPFGLQNSISFAKEGTWCEWSYIIDLDRMTFSIYSGGFLCKKARAWKKFSLTKLPTINDFLKMAERKEGRR